MNGIWEGSGNVNALDVLRAMAREPESVEALRSEVAAAAGADRRLDTAAAELEKALVDVDEAGARRLVERMCQVFAASLLVRQASPASPTPIARPGSAATGAMRSAPFPPAPTPLRSSSEPHRFSKT